MMSIFNWREACWTLSLPSWRRLISCCARLPGTWPCFHKWLVLISHVVRSRTKPCLISHLWPHTTRLSLLPLCCHCWSAGSKSFISSSTGPSHWLSRMGLSECSLQKCVKCCWLMQVPLLLGEKNNRKCGGVIPQWWKEGEAVQWVKGANRFFSLLLSERLFWDPVLPFSFSGVVLHDWGTDKFPGKV